MKEAACSLNILCVMPLNLRGLRRWHCLSLWHVMALSSTGLQMDVLRYAAVSISVLFIVHNERLCLMYESGGVSLCKDVLIVSV